MGSSETFAIAVLVGGLTVTAALLSNRLSRWLRVPAPAIVLLAAASAATFLPHGDAEVRDVQENIVTIALVFILLDGGMHIGWKRFRGSGLAIGWLGVVGTAATAAALAAVAHMLFGFGWPTSLVIGAALSPTDPAVVFSILGKREVTGRAATILEGESGANDPVGIALMVSLLAAGTSGSVSGAIGSGIATFLTQMGVGAAVGVAGGLALAWLMRVSRLPSQALSSVLLIAGATALYGAGAALHGSGFLAVFVAGILVGDVRAPFKQDAIRFTAGLASLGEVVAFVILGLGVRVDDVVRPDVLLTGLAIGALLIFVIRPVAVGVLLIPIRLRAGERLFVLWGGLKGAVPILLGLFVLDSGAPDARRVYAIIFIVVLFSVLVQGSLVPPSARLFRVPMREVEVLPWSVDVRFRTSPDGVEQQVVEAGSEADGATVLELCSNADGWVSIIVRSGHNMPVRDSTRLEAGDVVLTHSTSPEVFRRRFSGG